MNNLSKAKNYSVSVKEDEKNIIFLRKIVKGGTDRSYGIHVAEMAGIPKKVINRSNKILNSLSKDKKSVDFDVSEDNEDIEDEKLKLYKSILDRIKSIDTNKTSPLEGLILLNEIIDEVKDV